jgi:translation initiation factor IF-2
MYDERGNIVNVAGPSTPVSVLGLDGAATAEISLMCLKKKKTTNASKRSQCVNNLFVHNVILL